MSASDLTVVLCADHGTITGGQAKVAIDSALGLRGAGVRVVFFMATEPDPRLEAAGVEVVSLGQTDLLGNPSRAAAMLQGTWNRPAAAALERVLRGQPSARTVVHVHGWARALSPSIAGPIRDSGLPSAYTVHEYFLFCPTGGFYNYPGNHVCPLRPLSARCVATRCDQRNQVRKVWRAGRLALARHVAHLPDAFSDYVCISEFQRPIITPYLPDGAQLHRVSNPVDAADLGPKPEPASGDVVFVGRLSPEKGTTLFAEAAARIGVTPVFVGDGPVADELATRFPDARLLGWKSPAEVAQILRDARALVFPSLWYEGQPLTVLEAKAAGTPVIVSDGCAGREEVVDGVDGLWFRSGDVASLAEALRQVGDDATVARMSHAAHAAYWGDPPTLERHVERLLAVYEGMLARGA